MALLPDKQDLDPVENVSHVFDRCHIAGGQPGTNRNPFVSISQTSCKLNELEVFTTRNVSDDPGIEADFTSGSEYEQTMMCEFISDLDIKFSRINTCYFTARGVTKTKTIGNGSTRQVFKVVSDTDPSEVKAVKILPFFGCKSYEFLERMFFKEVAILQGISHPHILNNFSAYHCPGFGVLEMEYFPEGTLREVFKQRPQQQLHRFFVQIACALRFMHYRRYVHRDVKLDNILIRGQDAVLIDTGLSDRLPPGCHTAKGCVGTSIFMAPEVRRLQKGEEYDAYKADAYSLGCVLWALATGQRPLRSTKYCRELREFRYILDETVFTAIYLLLRIDPNNRCFVVQALAYLWDQDWHRDLIAVL